MFAGATLVSCPIDNMALVAIKMGCRSGSCHLRRPKRKSDERLGSGPADAGPLPGNPTSLSLLTHMGSRRTRAMRRRIAEKL
jgi:hypothetical protein